MFLRRLVLPSTGKDVEPMNFYLLQGVNRQNTLENWQHLPRLNTCTASDAAILFQSTDPTEMQAYFHQTSYTRMFTAVLFIIDKN